MKILTAVSISRKVLRWVRKVPKTAKLPKTVVDTMVWPLGKLGLEGNFSTLAKDISGLGRRTKCLMPSQVNAELTAHTQKAKAIYLEQIRHKPNDINGIRIRNNLLSPRWVARRKKRSRK